MLSIQSTSVQGCSSGPRQEYFVMQKNDVRTDAVGLGAYGKEGGSVIFTAV